MMTETVLNQVRDRLGPLSGEAEQAVTEALEIVRRMNGAPLSSAVEKEASDENFKGKNADLQEYLSWTDQQKLEYQTETENSNAKWVEKMMQELNAMWMIVIDGQLVASGPVMRTFPHDEEFDALCRKHGKYPFVFFSPRLFYIEETLAWHATKFSGDAYPTMRINLKSDAGQTELEADFDTGAVDTYLDLNLLAQKGVVTGIDMRPRQSSSHLGQNYWYTAKSLWLELKDNNGQSRQTEIVAICVANWSLSPFAAINRKRTALVGRDTMLQLQPMVLLDFAKRQTTVEFSTATNP